MSVGGLVDALEQAEQACNVVPFKHAFVRFLQLARRDRKLSMEQFAKKVDVDLVELMKSRLTSNIRQPFVPSTRSLNF